VVTRVSVTRDFLDLLSLEKRWKRDGVVTPVNVIEFVEVKGFEIRLGNTLLSVMLTKLIVDVHGVGYDHHLYVSMGYLKKYGYAIQHTKPATAPGKSLLPK